MYSVYSFTIIPRDNALVYMHIHLMDEDEKEGKLCEHQDKI